MAEPNQDEEEGRDDDDEDAVITCPNPDGNPACKKTFKREAGKKWTLCASCNYLRKEQRGKEKKQKKEKGGDKPAEGGNPLAGAMTAAAGMVAGSLGADKNSLLGAVLEGAEAFGFRRAGQVVADLVPDHVVNVARKRVPFPGAIAAGMPMAAGLLAHVAGASPHLRKSVIDGAADFAGTFRERITGEKRGREEEDAAAKAAADAMTRLNGEFEDKAFVNIEGEDGRVHLGSCLVVQSILEKLRRQRQYPTEKRIVLPVSAKDIEEHSLQPMEHCQCTQATQKRLDDLKARKEKMNVTTTPKKSGKPRFHEILDEDPEAAALLAECFVEAYPDENERTEAEHRFHDTLSTVEDLRRFTSQDLLGTPEEIAAQRRSALRMMQDPDERRVRQAIESVGEFIGLDRACDTIDKDLKTATSNLDDAIKRRRRARAKARRARSG